MYELEDRSMKLYLFGSGLRVYDDGVVLAGGLSNEQLKTTVLVVLCIC